MCIIVELDNLSGPRWAKISISPVDLDPDSTQHRNRTHVQRGHPLPNRSTLTARRHSDLDSTRTPVPLPVSTFPALAPPASHGEGRRRRGAHPALAVRRPGGPTRVRGGIGKAEAPGRASLLRPPLRALLRHRRSPQGLPLSLPFSPGLADLYLQKNVVYMPFPPRGSLASS
jgi:hypothetical protein